MDTLLQDIRYAVRALTKTPGLTLAAVVCLALGIGATTTVCTATTALVLHPVPATDPGRLVAINEAFPGADSDFDRAARGNYLDWRRESRSFDGLWAPSARCGACSSCGTRSLLLVRFNPGWTRFVVDAPILGFTFLVATATGVVFGIVPALFGSKVDLVSSLKDGGRGTTGGVRNRLRGALVIAEVALALVLLVSTGLMARSLAHLVNAPLGFRPECALTMELSLPPISYGDRARQLEFFARLLDRVHALPGVRSASLASVLPMAWNDWRRSAAMEGQPPVGPGQALPTVRYRVVSPGYFASVKIPLLRGRQFTERDDASSPRVAIVSNALAPQRVTAEMLGVFAGIALVMALVGIYGVMSYTVSRRTHEIGVRLALGAQRVDVMRIVLGRGSALAAAGIALGLVGALAMSRGLSSLLHGVGATDPVTFVAVPLVLGAVALSASWVPARRAAKVDPLVAMRGE